MKLRTLKYLFKDIWKFIKTLFSKNKMLVSPEVSKERLTICEGCIHIKKDAWFLWFKRSRCGICTCVLKEKVRWTFEECPDEPKQW